MLKFLLQTITNFRKSNRNSIASKLQRVYWAYGQYQEFEERLPLDACFLRETAILNSKCVQKP